MTILSAQSIRARCFAPDPMRSLESHYQPPLKLGTPLISPFHERTVHEGLTFGLSAAGLDIRVAEDVHLNSGGFALASTMERFCLPDDIMMKIHDKSSLARQGVALQNTVAEPGWEGFLTLELTFHKLGHFYIRAGTAIAQAVFHVLDQPTDQPYRGRYQLQKAGPQPAIMAKPGDL